MSDPADDTVVSRRGEVVTETTADTVRAARVRTQDAAGTASWPEAPTHAGRRAYSPGVATGSAPAPARHPHPVVAPHRTAPTFSGVRAVPAPIDADSHNRAVRARARRRLIIVLAAGTAVAAAAATAAGVLLSLPA